MDIVTADEVHGMYVIPPEPPIPLSMPVDGPSYKTGREEPAPAQTPTSDTFAPSRAEAPLMDRNALKKAISE